MTDSTNKQYDVVIVGGGVAGCYVAYRLLTATRADLSDDSPLLPFYQSSGKPNVGLFDYSGRVGGRVLVDSFTTSLSIDRGTRNHDQTLRTLALGGQPFQKPRETIEVGPTVRLLRSLVRADGIDRIFDARRGWTE